MLEISIVNKVSDELIESLSRLLSELTNSNKGADRSYLLQVVDSEATTLFVAKENNLIVGMLSLVIYLVPSGQKAWIEDVVVDNNYRGKGIAKKLVNFALQFAKKQNITKIDLTSSYHRTEAHKLYESMDFVKRETAVFRRKLDD